MIASRRRRSSIASHRSHIVSTILTPSHAGSSGLIFAKTPSCALLFISDHEFIDPKQGHGALTFLLNGKTPEGKPFGLERLETRLALVPCTCRRISQLTVRIVRLHCGSLPCGILPQVPY